MKTQQRMETVGKEEESQNEDTVQTQVTGDVSYITSFTQKLHKLYTQ